MHARIYTTISDAHDLARFVVDITRARRNELRSFQAKKPSAPARTMLKKIEQVHKRFLEEQRRSAYVPRLRLTAHVE